MSDELSTPLDLASIQSDLARSLVPAWAKGSETPGPPPRFEEERPYGERRGGFGGRRSGGDRDRGPRRERPFGRGAGGERPGPRQDRRGGGEQRGRRDDRRGDRREGRPPEREMRPEPVLAGWELAFKPDPRGVEEVARLIKAGARAYPLFDLAWLVLEKPERFRIEFRRAEGATTALFQVRLDGSVWTSEGEAVAHVMAQHLDRFYRRERVTVEPPKGSYPFIAVCGMSGALLGPPNFHDYQTKVRRLHAERYASMPFEVFKGRIRMERDEATIQKWREEQSSKDEFLPAETPEGAEPVRLRTPAELEQHFRQNHAPAAIVRINERVLVPGPVALGCSGPPARALARLTLDELRRFPLALAHTLGRQLASKGLHLFKAHKNITYVSVALPKHLDRKATPVAEGVSRILEYLEAHPATPRAEQWKALVAQRPIPDGGSEAERESALTADLLWLLREGHVIDFAKRGLQAAPPRRPAPERRGQPGAGAAAASAEHARGRGRRRRRHGAAPAGATAAAPAPDAPPADADMSFSEGEASIEEPETFFEEADPFLADADEPMPIIDIATPDEGAVTPAEEPPQTSAVLPPAEPSTDDPAPV